MPFAFLGKDFLLNKAIGWLCWLRIAPTAKVNATVSISKGILKLGKLRTDAYVIMSFNVVNACIVCVDH